MLEHNWLISKRLKGLFLILLLASFAPALHAEEESSTAPLIIENVSDSDAADDKDSKEDEEATPAGSSAFAEAFADAITKAETFINDSPQTPQAVKTFLEAHPKEIQWTKDHPLHVNAFALVLAILCRMCCGDTPNIPKPRVPQAVKPPKQKKEKPVPAKKPAEPVVPVEPPVPAMAAAAPEKIVNPFQKILEETIKSPVTPTRDPFIIQTFLRWSAAEPQPSYQWAIEQNDATLRRRLLTDALLAEAEKDASAAFDLALSALPVELQDPVIDAIVRQWTRKKPLDAAEKVVALPSGSPVLQTSIAALVETWADVDIQAAHHWLVALPVNLFRDLALSVFIQRLMVESPESAAAWVESIANDQVRQQVAGMVAQKWQAVDPEAANSWAEKTPV